MELKSEWNGWVCDGCAKAFGWTIPNDHVVSCQKAKCPLCGKERDLIPVSDFSRNDERREESDGRPR